MLSGLEIFNLFVSDHLKSFAASKLSTIFWDTWYIRTFYQNSRIDLLYQKAEEK